MRIIKASKVPNGKVSTPVLVFHCAKCGKPYQMVAMAFRLNIRGCVEFNKLICDAAQNNERLSIYYGDENPLKDGCNCEEGGEQ